jgi:hypothetical protein
MRILSLHAGHDGAIAYIEDGHAVVEDVWYGRVPAS